MRLGAEDGLAEVNVVLARFLNAETEAPKKDGNETASAGTDDEVEDLARLWNRAVLSFQLRHETVKDLKRRKTAVTSAVEAEDAERTLRDNRIGFGHGKQERSVCELVR